MRRIPPVRQIREALHDESIPFICHTCKGTGKVVRLSLPLKAESQDGVDDCKFCGGEGLIPAIPKAARLGANWHQPGAPAIAAAG